MWLERRTAERVLDRTRPLTDSDGLTLPELDHDEVGGYFEKAGLGDLHERLRAPG